MVIDAGGTNFRCALVHFGNGEYSVEHMRKCKMPGIDKPATWEEFISFTADMIMPIVGMADKIGFCFSYTANITPEIDGKVVCIDKEVVITGSAGQLVGASLEAELEKRGISGKRVIVINDTVAALLGGSVLLNRDDYSGIIGQISGTGTNTCCALPISSIPKLKSVDSGEILINLESGMYAGVTKGDFDCRLDAESNNPGYKGLEKLSSGAYLGELCRLTLRAAADDGEFSEYTTEKVRAMEKLDSAVVDCWAGGDGLEAVTDNVQDGEFIKTLCLAIFERSARCMCVCLTAIMLLTGSGIDKPVCICAEGSLVQKGRFFRPKLLELLEECAGAHYGRSFKMLIGEETTLPGAAVAALLN